MGGLTMDGSDGLWATAEGIIATIMGRQLTMLAREGGWVRGGRNSTTQLILIGFKSDQKQFLEITAQVGMGIVVIE